MVSIPEFEAMMTETILDWTRPSNVSMADNTTSDNNKFFFSMSIRGSTKLDLIIVSILPLLASSGWEHTLL